MQQRPTRYYITQDEDQTVVRSVPMTRRAQAVLPPDERATNRDEEPRQTEAQRSVADRFRAAVRRGAAGARR